MSIQTLIVDDEPLARDRLRQLPAQAPLRPCKNSFENAPCREAISRPTSPRNVRDVCR